MIDRRALLGGHTVLPRFPCPTCGQGYTKPGEIKAADKEEDPSLKRTNPDLLGPEDDHGLFQTRLMCTNSGCQQRFMVSGIYYTDWTGYSQEHGSEFLEDNYRILSIIPAPHIITVPQDLPDEVKGVLDRAFQHFWGDPDACANAVRSVIEQVLDALGVASESTNAKGKTTRLNLYQRLDLIKASHPSLWDCGDALRETGNLGSHGDGGVTHEMLADAFQVLEPEVMALKRPEVLKRLRESIAERKKEAEAAAKAKAAGAASNSAP